MGRAFGDGYLPSVKQNRNRRRKQMKRLKDMLNDEFVQVAILLTAVVTAVAVPLSPMF